MGEGLDLQLAAEAPAGRPATADEIAEAIVFLVRQIALVSSRARNVRRRWRQNRYLIIVVIQPTNFAFVTGQWDREGTRTRRPDRLFVRVDEANKDCCDG